MMNEWIIYGSLSIAAIHGSSEEDNGPSITISEEAYRSSSIEQDLTGKREETCEGRKVGGAQSSSGMHLETSLLEDEVIGDQFGLGNELVWEAGERDKDGVDESIQADSSVPDTVPT